jgi:hypothetical protein
MASGSGAGDLAADPPPKLRRKPQRKGSIGLGKTYADEAAFVADVEAWKVEQRNHQAVMKERERQQDRRRDRSERQRDGDVETDAERRVRQRRESPAQVAAHRAQAATHRADLSAWEQASREQGIASGRLISLQSDQLQFTNADEREAFAEHCPLGCPHASPVLLGTGLLRRCHKNGPPHVCIMLRVRKAVRVGGAIVGYGQSCLAVRRVDTCTCPACDETRRGIREAWRMCRLPAFVATRSAHSVAIMTGAHSAARSCGRQQTWRSTVVVMHVRHNSVTRTGVASNTKLGKI